jgi:quercetin dioxygenase-like cupin family protein
MSSNAPRVLLRSEESNGEVSAIEIVAGAGFAGPSLHRHDFDEAFYVLDGELTFQLGDERFVYGPGELAFAPRAVAHTFANLSGKAARALIVCTPAGFERYFARVAAKIEGVDPPAWASKEIPEVVRLGPPIGGRR